MSDENESAHHPDDQLSTWTLPKAYRHMDMIREHMSSNQEAASVANFALMLLLNLSCPHAEDEHVRCLRPLAEHYPELVELLEGGDDSSNE